jgi:uncharacterized protein (UPF0332 family)
MSAFWSKAQGAARSARLLAAEGDPNGAANRAYYAMFNAARAALEARTNLDIVDVRRHSAVLQLFSLHIVRAGLVDPSISRALNEVFNVRAIAGYDEEAVSPTDAGELIESMDAMLAAVEPLLKGQP